MTDKKQLENQEKEIKMPWQGKVWIIINSIWLIIAFIILILVLFFLLEIKYLEMGFDSELNDLELLDKFKFLGSLFLIVGAFFSIIVTGFVKGWRWMVNIILILSMFSVLKDFMSMLYIALDDGNKIEFMIDLIFLPYSILMTYLAWFCSKHPFYNQKKLKVKH